MTANLDGRLAREAHEVIDRAMVEAHYTHAEARDADCWFDADRVASEPATTAWKRLARWRQAQWRDAQGHPIGSDPYRGGLRGKRVGSRIELEHARESGANFLTAQAHAAVRSRLALREDHQVLDADALWADLLSPLALCFNLFGPLSSSPGDAERAVRAFWPELPRGPTSLRFAHCPGRRSPAFLDDDTAFDLALEIEGDAGVVFQGLSVLYHEHVEPEAAPPTAALGRYLAVAERSDVFLPGWQDVLPGSRLQSIWRGHLLVLSMLQHPSRHWQTGRFLLVYPALNPSIALAVASYRELLREPSTFSAVTIESLLRTPGALDRATRDAIQARYI
ncbi:MAG TPA: hypothetical protein VJR89_41515 [Polyangiales bacterium]|nr:hypothetical protein [Polyangiales bacterium]